ncbi:hypothetical protein NDU88_010151 [Pleurodeles waltl]|uniref:Uncharacterized protein n=1 Tax=Pleurodeles waltl TaxID=8319 RepID=A0AAV7RXB9_PLEWA|nr:hypothetical protein NDU88_010151 [Pleurodeles waltl]
MGPQPAPLLPPSKQATGDPPGLRRHHQDGEAQQPRRMPPGSRAPQIICVLPARPNPGPQLHRGAAARQDR